MKTLQSILLALALTAMATGASATRSFPFATDTLTDNKPSLNLAIPAEEQGDTAASDSVQGSTAASIAHTDNIAINRVYPDPAVSNLYIDLSSSAEAPATIRLVDMLGRTVLQKPVMLVNGQNHLHLDMNDVSAGVYQLVVQAGAKRISYNLIKVR